MFKKQCTVSIIGLANAGKSTFLNNIVGYKASIVSCKPQTTRNQINAIYSKKWLDICFIDTPGFLKQKTKLDSFLNSQIKQSIKKADILLFFIDPSRDNIEQNQTLFKLINSYKVYEIIIVFTHKDLIKINDDKYWLNHYKFNSIKHSIFISCFNKNDINNLISLIYKLAPNNGNFCPSKINDDFIIKEIIREIALKTLKQEVPHCLAISVDTNQFNQQKNLLTVNCSLIVEKDSQKKIVIGKKGSMIKLIGTKSRAKLLEIFDCKIMLKLFVKVRNDWRNDEVFLKSLGYFKN